MHINTAILSINYLWPCGNEGT